MFALHVPEDEVGGKGHAVDTVVEAAHQPSRLCHDLPA